jgi:hypothetical protein
VFDPSVIVCEKRLQHLVEMHFLRKSRAALKQLEEEHAVIIAVHLRRPTPSPNAVLAAPGGGGNPAPTTQPSPAVGRGRRGRGGAPPAAGRGQVGRGRGGPQAAKAAGRGHKGTPGPKPVDKKGKAGATPAAAKEKGKRQPKEDGGRQRSRELPAAPVVEIRGASKTSVDRAMSGVDKLLAKATRKQSSFRNPNEGRYLTLLEAKMKELGQADPHVAVFTARQPDGALVVHMMGSDKAQVDALAQRPNHYMTKLTVARFQLTAKQFKRINVGALTKAYGLLIEYDRQKGEVLVVGPRDAIQSCIDDMKLTTAAAGNGQQAQQASVQQLTLTSGHALFFKQHLQVNYGQLKVRPLKKGAVSVTGPADELDVVEHLINKLVCCVLPYLLSPELADGFMAFVNQQLARLGIASVVMRSLVSADSDDESEDESEGEEEEEEEEEDEGDDITYISNCGHEDQAWARIEVWCFTGTLVPTYCETMGFFASEQSYFAQQLVPVVQAQYAVWTHIDTINRIITCVSFEPTTVIRHLRCLPRVFVRVRVHVHVRHGMACC